MRNVSKGIITSGALPFDAVEYDGVTDMIKSEYQQEGVFKCLVKMVNVSFSVALLVFLTSCYPWFDNPLPIPKEGLKVDERILGSWTLSENGKGFEKGDTYAHIYPQKLGWVDVFYFEIGDAGCLQFSGYTSRVGETPVLCLWTTRVFKGTQGEVDVEKSPGCWMFPYKITDDGMLHIWGIDQAKLEAYIADGKLKGEITRTPSKMHERKEVKVRASSEELETLFNTVGVAELLSKNPEMSFYRLNTPERKPFTPPEKP